MILASSLGEQAEPVIDAQLETRFVRRRLSHGGVGAAPVALRHGSHAKAGAPDVMGCLLLEGQTRIGEMLARMQVAPRHLAAPA